MASFKFKFFPRHVSHRSPSLASALVTQTFASHFKRRLWMAKPLPQGLWRLLNPLLKNRLGTLNSNRYNGTLSRPCGEFLGLDAVVLGTMVGDFSSAHLIAELDTADQ